MRIGELSKGDFIKYHDADEAAYIADRLQQDGYDWDFVYEHDGQKGIWIEIQEDEASDGMEGGVQGEDVQG